MSADTLPPPADTRPRWTTLGEIIRSLGDIPADRIRSEPKPGTATEADCLRLNESGVRCELVNGTLVETAVGSPQAILTGILIELLGAFARPKRLGSVANSDGMYRMTEGNIREPDIGFIRRGRVPVPATQVFDLCPDLCVEVISPGNTAGEMAMKRAEYFASGCRLMWVIHVDRQTIDVYTAADAPAVRLTEGDTLTGGDVLPGFNLSVAELFREFRIGMELEAG